MSSTIQGISAIQKPVETAEKIVQKATDAASYTVTEYHAGSKIYQ